MSDLEHQIAELQARLAQTERRLTEMAERYAAVTGTAKVGVWDWNLSAREFYLDPGVKALLGYRDDELGNDIEIWSEQVHRDDREAFRRSFSDAIAGRTLDYVMERRVRHKDGTFKWLRAQGRVLRDAAGRPERFIGTDADVTPRRELQRQVLELSDELKTQIGHDLHDGLGQDLTALALKLRCLETVLTEEGSSHLDRVTELRDLARRAIESMKALALGLSPVLTGTGLGASLEELAAGARRLYGIAVHIELHGELPKRFSGTYANELYRIAQEALSNAVKHAQATRIDIAGRVIGPLFHLSIADDGKGFVPPNPNGPAMGLKIMEYRVRHLGGSLTVSRRNQGGTLIVCTCPVLR